MADFLLDKGLPCLTKSHSAWNETAWGEDTKLFAGFLAFPVKRATMKINESMDIFPETRCCTYSKI